MTRRLLVLFLCLSVEACGLKGSLYLPEDDAEVTVREPISEIEESESSETEEQKDEDETRR